MTSVEEDPCLYCGSKEGSRSIRMLAECRGCGRIVAERQWISGHLYVDLPRESLMAVPSPDFLPVKSADVTSIHHPTAAAPATGQTDDVSLETRPMYDIMTAPYASRFPLPSLTTDSLPGQLAELERVLGDVLFPSDSAIGHVSPDGIPSLMTTYLLAYFHILDVASRLNLPRDLVDQGVHTFKLYLAEDIITKREVEHLATAALMLAIRTAGASWEFKVPFLSLFLPISVPIQWSRYINTDHTYHSLVASTFLVVPIAREIEWSWITVVCDDDLAMRIGSNITTKL